MTCFFWQAYHRGHRKRRRLGRPLYPRRDYWARVGVNPESRDSGFDASASPWKDGASQLTAANGGFSVAVRATSRFNSGMQEPQLVPAFSRAPISAAPCAPAAIASQMVLRPTPKQAQTMGPVPASPSLERPDSSMRR